MRASGTPARRVLDLLTSTAEEISGNGSVASILLLDSEGLLRNGASPKLPEDYLQEIDGIRPHPELGTCASAAATGEIVITPDFMADDKWAELRHLPLAIGFVGAWSMPIKTREGKVLGTFGTYFTTPRKPTDREIEAVKLLAEAVAQVIEARS